MSKLLLQPTEIAQWWSAINQAQQDSSTLLEEPIESYLVFMLQRNTQQQALQGALAEEYLTATTYPAHQREQKLRVVGDKSLLLAGLFPGQAARRHVPLRYFTAIGQASYSMIAQHADDNLLFERLADEFTLITQVLRALREPLVVDELLPRLKI
jgi:hypothetical protein